MTNVVLYFFVAIFLAFSGAALFLSYTIVMAFRSLGGRSDLRNKQTINVDELAKIEKMIDRLVCVTVIADKLNPPGKSLALAIQDNFLQGVKYQYFVSNRTTQEEVRSYHSFLGHILAASRIINPDTSRADSINRQPANEPQEQERYYSIHRIDYDPTDYPYVCYEYLESEGSNLRKVLMYRGTEKGVGIAGTYKKVEEALAYSLITRMRFLEGLLPSNETSYQNSDQVGLRNKSAQQGRNHLRVVRNDPAV